MLRHTQYTGIWTDWKKNNNCTWWRIQSNQRWYQNIN